MVESTTACAQPTELPEGVKSWAANRYEVLVMNTLSREKTIEAHKEPQSGPA